MQVTRTLVSCTPLVVATVVQTGVNTHVLTVDTAAAPSAGSLAVAGPGIAPAPLAVAAAAPASMSWQVKPNAAGTIEIHWTSVPAGTARAFTFEYT
jgi:hypothetical protein